MAFSLFLLSACGDGLEARSDSNTQTGGDNYGEARIGYKGAALSRAAALTGDESESAVSSSNAGSFGSTSAPGIYAGGAGGAAAPISHGGVGSGTIGGTVAGSIGGTLSGTLGGTAGGTIGVGSAPPLTVAVQDAGSATLDAAILYPDAGVIDASAVPDAQLDAAALPDTSLNAADTSVVADAQVAFGDAQAQALPMRDAATFIIDAAANGTLVSLVDAGGGVSIVTDAASARPSPDAALPTTVAADLVPENPFHRTSEEATSTFSIDVDTGSYTLARASILAGHSPTPKSVRVEEFLNYFHFHYAQPEGDMPLSVYTEMGACPWNPERKLLLVGIQGQEVDLKDQPPANLVFLIDVSGSMASPEKLPLLKKGFRMLASQLRKQDRVAIVTYAGHDSVALPSTPGDQKQTIFAAIDRLESGGSTNGEGGIQKAYELAQQSFMKNGNNRVLLATDGDFNVGLSGTDQLKALIATKRSTGVYLSVYGFGTAWDGGNYKDDVGEQLADNGDGIYFYVDSPEEARRAFIESVSGSLLSVAKDVKVQLELNPAQVQAYRLIGYENRVLANSAFSNDAVDAGELGAGLSVTALFEIIPAEATSEVPSPLPGSVPELAGATTDAGVSDEQREPVQGEDLLEIRLRYKTGKATASKLVRQRYGREIVLDESTPKFLFAAGVSELAMRLRHSQYLGARRDDALLIQIGKAKPLDKDGAIEELIQLTMSALGLSH